MRNGLGECSDLPLEHGTGRHLAFEDGDKDGQFSGINKGVVFRILVAPERPQAHPGLTTL